MARIYRPIAFIRLSSASIGIVMALPSLAGLGMVVVGEGSVVNGVGCLFFAAGGLHLSRRCWRASAEIDDRELRLHGLFRTKVFELRTIGRIDEGMDWSGEWPTKVLVLVDVQGNPLAEIGWIWLLRGHQELIRLIRARAAETSEATK